MKTGFWFHLAAGLVAALLLTVVLAAATKYSAFVLGVAAAVFVLGSVIPDLDAPVSVVRKAFDAVLFVVLLAALVLLLYAYQPKVMKWCEPKLGGSANCLLVQGLLAIALPTFTVRFVDMLIPGHRGFLHSFSASVLYGIVVAYVVPLAMKAGGSEIIFIGIAAGAGYVLHILLDVFGSAA